MSNPQNYVQILSTADGNHIPCWHGWTDEIYTGILSATTNYAVTVPTGANFCHVVVNSGTMYIDITNAITSIPSGFTKGTVKLIDNQETNYYYIPIGTTSVNIYNAGATTSPATIVFGRTRAMYQDINKAFPKGDFG